MTRWIYTVVFLSIVARCLLAQTSTQQQRPDRGQWSGETTRLLPTYSGAPSMGKTQTIFSPDQQKLIRVKGDKVILEVQGKVFPTDFGLKFLAELGWAPDSSKFFLTWSDAGWGGTYHTQVYQASSTGLRKIRGISRRARRDFIQHIRRMPPPKQFAEEPALGYWLALHYCEPNIVGAQWLNGSNELLISALVPNTSYCRHMCEFNVYQVSVPGGRIVQRYSAEEAHRQFNEENLPIISR